MTSTEKEQLVNLLRTMRSSLLIYKNNHSVDQYARYIDSVRNTMYFIRKHNLGIEIPVLGRNTKKDNGLFTEFINIEE